MPDDPHIIYSDLCCTLTLDGVTVEVQIYRLEHDPEWSLEVINERGTSTVWDDLFDTDQDALRVFEQTVIEEGIQAFLDNGDVETLH